jgi:hypothetical protein
MSRAIDGLTLRDKCREADRILRELADHLEQSFLPKARSLRKLARGHEQGYDPSIVRDVTIRSQASALLEAEQYTARLDEESKLFFTAIAAEIDQLVTTGTL